MTREDDIKEVAGTYAKDACNPASKRGLLYDGFVDGAEWADRTMIENACEWLTRELCYTARGNNLFNNKTATDEFIESFKKAMKGD